MPQPIFNIPRGIRSTGPTLFSENKVGTALASATLTGTPVDASWQIQLQNDADGGITAIAIDAYSGAVRRMPVRASEVNTVLIPGITITFSGSIAAGNIFNVAYTDTFVVNT